MAQHSTVRPKRIIRKLAIAAAVVGGLQCIRVENSGSPESMDNWGGMVLTFAGIALFFSLIVNPIIRALWRGFRSLSSETQGAIVGGFVGGLAVGLVANSVRGHHAGQIAAPDTGPQWQSQF